MAVLSLTLAAGLQAKTIHWLTFIDTTDESVGSWDANTRQILYARWINIVNASLAEEGYNVNPIDIYGNATSPQKCKEVVNDLRCGSEDIIVFYYIGHGTENTGASKYPLMLLASSNPNLFVPLSWVHNTLKSKGARLTISIGMCCNARQGVYGRNAPAYSVNYGNTYVDDDMSESIKKMFLEYKGDIIATSSSPNESSWTYYDEALGKTDFFTYYLIDQFTNDLPNRSKPSWENMFAEIKTNVSDGVESCEGIQSRYPGSTQTPIWDCNVIAASRPGKDKIVKPRIDENSNEITETKNVLDKVFAFLSSSNADERERIELAQKLEMAFPSNLIVKTVSQDGNVVVQKEPISVFLGRISTSRILMGVSVADLSMDNGRVTALRVREVYKK